MGMDGTKTNSQQIGGKLILSLFFSAFLVIGCILEYNIIKDFIATLATHFWTASGCIIEHASIDEKTPYKFKVSYSYEYGGKQYSSDVLFNDYNGSTDYYTVQKLFENYPVGSAAQCRVNPRDPTSAVLQMRSLWSGL